VIPVEALALELILSLYFQAFLVFLVGDRCYVPHCCCVLCLSIERDRYRVLKL